MKVHANKKRSHERSVCTDGMSPRNPFAGQRELFVALLVFGRHGRVAKLRDKAIESVLSHKKYERELQQQRGAEDSYRKKRFL